MQIKSQPLANKILGLANKTTFAGADFTLPEKGPDFNLPLGLPLLPSQHRYKIKPNSSPPSAKWSGAGTSERHVKGSDKQNWFQLAK